MKRFNKDKKGLYKRRREKHKKEYLLYKINEEKKRIPKESDYYLDKESLHKNDSFSERLKRFSIIEPMKLILGKNSSICKWLYWLNDVLVNGASLRERFHEDIQEKYIDSLDKKRKNIFLLGICIFLFFHFFREHIFPHFPIIYNVVDSAVKIPVYILGSITNLIGIRDDAVSCLFGCLMMPILYSACAFVEIAIYVIIAYILYSIYEIVFVKKK